MPWVPLDTHYLRDPKIQAAGELTPFALSAFPALLAEAKQRADGGKLEVSFRALAFDLFISPEDARKAITALLSVGILEAVSAPVPACPQLSDLSQVVRFASWRKWNERFRKSQYRAAEAHE